MRFVFFLLLLSALATPALAQPSNGWRAVNRTGQEATGLVAVEPGATTRGRNRLREPLADGAEKGFRRRADAPCRLDLRLRLTDGREAALPGHDICATPTVLFEAASIGPAATPPGRAGRPRASGEGERTRVSTGTGFLVADGRVMTNHHVVEDCTGIQLRAPGGHRYNAVPPVQRNKELDLAVLHVPGVSGPALPFRQALPRRGESVVAYGFPLAGVLSSDPKLTRGEVSGLAGIRDDPSQFQISAPLQPGNSGGPLLDMQGRLVGINTAVLRPMGRLPPQNVNFAVKADRAVAFLRAAGVTPRLAGDTGADLGTVQVGEIAGRSVFLIVCTKGATP